MPLFMQNKFISTSLLNPTINKCLLPLSKTTTNFNNNQTERTRFVLPTR